MLIKQDWHLSHIISVKILVEKKKVNQRLSKTRINQTKNEGCNSYECNGTFCLALKSIFSGKIRSNLYGKCIKWTHLSYIVHLTGFKQIDLPSSLQINMKLLRRSVADFILLVSHDDYSHILRMLKRWLRWSLLSGHKAHIGNRCSIKDLRFFQRQLEGSSEQL